MFIYCIIYIINIYNISYSYIYITDACAGDTRPGPRGGRPDGAPRCSLPQQDSTAVIMESLLPQVVFFVALYYTVRHMTEYTVLLDSFSSPLFI